MKYAIYTLGCKVNQYETQAVETMLRERGYEAVQENADVVIVNTCAVTAESGRKSRQAIRRLMQKNPGALTAVCGCFSQLEPEQTEAIGVDIVHGTGDKKAFVQAIEDGVRSRLTDDPFRRLHFEPLPPGAASGRTRAMMKIQDGCDNFCTYCVIPYTRGRVRSLPLQLCYDQAAELAADGYAEIVVTGIEIASYGKDLPGRPGLIDAVEQISAAAPQARIHLGSLEPTLITPEFCTRLAALPNICPHFHPALQSGCDAVLQRMHRKYDTARFLRACENLREAFPQCCLTTDLICGFPGETEEEFQTTLAFLETCGFFYVHAFPYSPRPGTKAAAMPGQLENAEKERRVRRANELIHRLRDEYLALFVGRTMSVLFENAHEGHADNYCVVRTAAEYPRGEVHQVVITGYEDGCLYAE